MFIILNDSFGSVNFYHNITMKYNDMVNSYANLYHRTNQLLAIIKNVS